MVIPHLAPCSPWPASRPSNPSYDLANSIRARTMRARYSSYLTKAAAFKFPAKGTKWSRRLRWCFITAGFGAEKLLSERRFRSRSLPREVLSAFGFSTLVDDQGVTQTTKVNASSSKWLVISQQPVVGKFIPVMMNSSSSVQAALPFHLLGGAALLNQFARLCKTRAG